MRYLSGSKNSAHEHLYADGTIGLLKTPATGYSVANVKVWALDNGAFTDQYPGHEAYLQLLDRLEPHKDRCLFVALPDVVGDARATLQRSHEIWHQVRVEKGWPVALVLQDGMQDHPVRSFIPWDALDWVFVGGSDEFKLGPGARSLCSEAHARGVKIHVGRVNSLKRFAYARDALHADTADGTALAFNPSARLPEVLSWLRSNDQGRLELA